MLNPVTPAFLDGLRAFLPPMAFREATDAYLREPRGRLVGQGVVVAPGSVEEVAAVVRACAAARVGIVPHGGGTGLVGGQIMGEGPLPVILSSDRLRAVRAVYPSENVLVAEAGVTLRAVQEAAEGVDRLFPLSLASEGSARVGGFLSTNAGGVHVLRYGNARALCLGVEVVSADGSVWHGLSRLRKDNTGYDLRDLVIGAEGTLGVITAASLKLSPRPAAVGAALLAVQSPAAALELLALVQGVAGEGVSAFEIMHRIGFTFLDETGLGLTPPLSPLPDWMVLIELGLSHGTAPEAVLEGIFEVAAGKRLVTDGVIAQSEAQRKAFWHIRETIPEANRRIGSISSHDISLPLSEVAGFIAEGEVALAALGAFRINCFGHLGDGNLHYNVFPLAGESRSVHDNKRAAIKECVHDMVHARSGSVSAEHGIGRLKVGDLEKYGDPVKLAMMRAVKAALDPAGIMNPGAVLRPVDFLAKS
ncbi:MAG: FAD-binding oxidoreductase [Rhodobacterales bacterium]|nr:FAD-binding oxidoreductase [Rhodobacterales bacterium]